MAYPDYTRQTPGRYVAPDIPVGVVPLRAPPPAMFGPHGPYGARYASPCDQMLGANLAGDAMSPYPAIGPPPGAVMPGAQVHPRNWDLFEYPTGEWRRACPGGGGPTAAYPVPAWARRQGPFVQSVQAEGFAPRPLTPPWIAPAGNPTVTREHPYDAGRVNPMMWPAPGAQETSFMRGVDPRPLYYGAQAPTENGVPAHYGPFYPSLRSEHIRNPPRDTGEPACGGCGGRGGGGSLMSEIDRHMPSPAMLAIIFVVLILWVCLAASAKSAAPVAVIMQPLHAAHQKLQAAQQAS